MINLQLLGGLAIEGSDLAANAPSGRHYPLALLAMVAVAASKPVAREKLLGMSCFGELAGGFATPVFHTMLWVDPFSFIIDVSAKDQSMC